MLRRWINDPLIDVSEINKRLDSVKELKDSQMLKGEIVDSLKKVYDIERLIGKISYGNANGRDLISLKNSLGQIPDLKNILRELSIDNEIDILVKHDNKEIHRTAKFTKYDGNYILGIAISEISDIKVIPNIEFKFKSSGMIFSILIFGTEKAPALLENGVTVPRRAAMIFAHIPFTLPSIFLALSGGK